MKQREPEELLRELSGADVDPIGSRSESTVSEDSGVLHDAVLQAYRSGELPEAEMNTIESQLEESAAARNILTQLAELEQPEAVQRVRDRLFASDEVAVDGAHLAAGSSPDVPRRGLGHWLKIAAVLLAVVLAGLMLRALYSTNAQQLTRAAWVSELTFAVDIQGEATVRSNSTSQVAYPDTIVRIRAAVDQAVLEPIAYGLYRLDGETVRRLGESDGLTVDDYRGAVAWSGQASDWLGSEPGDHLVYLVVAAVGQLPADTVVAPGVSPEAALAAPGRQVLPQKIVVIAPPS